MGEPLDQFHYHEVLDRLHVALSILDDHLLAHPVVKQHAGVRGLIEDASERLADAYQVAGRLKREQNT